MDNEPIQTKLMLPIINHETDNQIISQRIEDGYVNATAMCKAAGKRWGDYYALSTTKPFLEELAAVNGQTVNGLIQRIVGGIPELQGTWVHPQVAIHLAQWLSPKFAVLVTQWVMDWLSGKLKAPNLPYHLRRYMANMHNVPYGYFSMLNEITLHLIGPLEQLGYSVTSDRVPDISMGQIFSKYLRENGYPVDTYPTYKHYYEDGRVVDARAYPNEHIEMVRKFFVEEWLKNRAEKYFKEKEPEALPYLRKMLMLPNLRRVMGYLDAQNEYTGFDKTIKKALDYNPNQE